ncbi:hypothetical protein RJT34_11429 [Clitoria ternatea]|uniref:Uncharacterized protein n=1 Tax=Clitoria ternatea TaxID=43366 RepID=A0AAN9JK33_CLITE
MRVKTSLIVLFSLQCLLFVQLSSAEFPHDVLVSARLLDSHLQDWAFKAFSSPRTGLPYDGEVPTNLTGIKVSAIRLRSGSLRERGVQSYKEFEIPIGVIEEPYVERLVLVYHNLGNWSHKFYPLPGYSYLAPVLGLLAYDGTNLNASGLHELDIRASDEPILIKFPDLKHSPFGPLVKCVYFDLHGSVHIDIPLHGNLCATSQQGHFSIVVESNASSPAPSPSGEVQGGGKNTKSTLLRKVVLYVVGGIVLLAVFGVLVDRIRRALKRTEIRELENVAESGENLDMTTIGDYKVPLAFGTRTRPMINMITFLRLLS